MTDRPATGLTRDFAVSVLVVWRSQVLLHRHRKLGIWLPPGGHVDRLKGSLPDMPTGLDYDDGLSLSGSPRNDEGPRGFDIKIGRAHV